MAYVGGSQPSPGCIFCAALAATDDRSRLLLHRGAHAFLILNAYPYTPGHVMSVLNRHVGSIPEAEDEELAELLRLAGVASRALTAEYRAEGFNIGVNQGRVAGAGVEDHLHLHVVPRWSGDTNFMPVLGEVRVLPESLEATYDRLKKRLDG
jgi:ATP adenylyltransferase